MAGSQGLALVVAGWYFKSAEPNAAADPARRGGFSAIIAHSAVRVRWAWSLGCGESSGVDPAHLVTGEHDRQPLGPFGAAGVDLVAERAFKDDFVQEKHRGQGLVLCRRGDLAFHGEMGEERLHFRLGHLERMTFVVKADVSFDPVHIGILRADAVMQPPRGHTNPIEEPRRIGEFLASAIPRTNGPNFFIQGSCILDESWLSSSRIYDYTGYTTIRNEGVI